jgi:hypothetical protein
MTITCDDHIVLTARYPAKHFDLAIIAPLYGSAPAGGNWDIAIAPVED